MATQLWRNERRPRDNCHNGDLKDEVIRIIRDTRGFGSILLSELIDKTETAIKDLQFEVKQLHKPIHWLPDDNI